MVHVLEVQLSPSPAELLFSFPVVCSPSPFAPVFVRALQRNRALWAIWRVLNSPHGSATLPPPVSLIYCFADHPSVSFAGISVNLQLRSWYSSQRFYSSALFSHSIQVVILAFGDMTLCESGEKMDPLPSWSQTPNILHIIWGDSQTLWSLPPFSHHFANLAKSCSALRPSSEGMPCPLWTLLNHSLPSRG